MKIWKIASEDIELFMNIVEGILMHSKKNIIILSEFFGNEEK